MPVILWMLGPVGRYVMIALALVGAFLYARQHWIDQGYDKAITKVNTQNEKAKQEGINAAKDVDDCIARGGWWDISRGICSLRP